MSTCVIVVPVYKALPKDSEKASFKQCLEVLGKYDICLATYESLDLSQYEQMAQTCGKRYRIQFFNKDFFASVSGYNRLCFDKAFYLPFAGYEYMLIYQLDAWVFRDELQMWCNKGYDYVGAPFFRNIAPEGEPEVYSKEMIGIGNGGLSLRRVAYCLALLDRPRWAPYLKPAYVWQMAFERRRKKGKSYLYSWLLATCASVLKSGGFRNSLAYFVNSGEVNEDIYFSLWPPYAWVARPNLPSCQDAVRFAFEIHPSYLYGQTRCLPFGCHAFEKYEFSEFWNKHICY